MRAIRLIVYVLCLLSISVPVLAQSRASITAFAVDRQSITPDEAESGAAYVNLSWTTSGVSAGQMVKLQVLVLGQWLDALPAGTPPLNASGTLRWTVPHTLDFIPPTFRLAIVDSANALVDKRDLVIPYVNVIDPLQPPKITAFNSPITAINARDFSRADFNVPVQYQVVNRPARANVIFEQMLDNGKVVSIELPRFNTWIRSGGNGVVKPVADGGDVLLRITLVNIDTRQVYAQQTLSIPVLPDTLPVPPNNPPAPGKADVVGFTSSAYNLKRGEKITLNWDVKNATSIRLEVYDLDYFPAHFALAPQILKENLPAAGSMELTVPADYTGGGWQLHLLADNSANPGYDFIRLDLVFTDVPQQVLLNLNSFTATPELVKRGDVITITWDGYVTTRLSHFGVIQYAPMSGYEDDIYLYLFGNGQLPLPNGHMIRDLPLAHGSAEYLVPGDYDAAANFISINIGLRNVPIQGVPTDVTFGIVSVQLVPPPDVATTENVPAAFQQFEGGMMIWNGNTGEVSVYYGMNGGQMVVYPLDSYSGQPDNPAADNPPDGMLKPVNAFGRVWGNNPNVRQALGWATGGETGYTMTRITRVNEPDTVTLTLPNARRMYQFRNTWNF